MTGLKPGRVELSEHDQHWSRVFERERDRVKSALGPEALAIEHVGSTSIPGIAAKPIVDIAVAIREFEAFAPHVPTVERLGYIYRGENGIPRRHYFLLGDPRIVHLHFLEISGPNWRQHLVFRETMRASPKLRRAYEALKRDLAARFPNDREAYTAGKHAFIMEVLEKGMAAEATLAGGSSREN